MKTTAFTLTKEGVVSALLEYATDNDLDVDIDANWIVIQQEDGAVDCSRGEE